jgi:hypothetical protein
MTSSRDSFAFAIVAMAGWPAWGQPADAESIATEPDTNRPGNDIRMEAAGDFLACRTQCDGEPRCRAWTFVPPGVEGEPGQCWVKEMVAPAEQALGLVSGIKKNTLSEESWALNRFVDTNSSIADVLVRVGDVDNFGYDWPADFTPFAGRSTPVHAYPWGPEGDDADGTDRIMVGTGYRGEPPRGTDGYTDTTSRPDNAIRAIEVSYPLNGIQVRAAVLQLFVDDFQAPVLGSVYHVQIDGERIPGIEQVINALEQTGPVG